MRQTPRKVDIHTHVLPERWPDLRERYGYGGFVRMEHHGPGCARMMIDDQHFRDVRENLWDPRARLADCERHGVELQVLSTVPVMFSYWAKPADALDLSRLLNDHIADLVSRHPDRFAGLGTVPLQAPELAIKELQRCVRELGLAGVQIGSHVNDWNLGDRELFGFFEAAQDLGAAVFVHPWDILGGRRMDKYCLKWLVGMPAETALAICSMIFAGVFERLPRLRVAFAHAGGAFPYTIGRVERGFHARPDLCCVDTKLRPRDHLGRFYVDSLTHDPQALRYLIELLGAERVALGSDYPFVLGEPTPGEMIAGMTDLAEPVRRRLLAESALEWLGKR